MTNAPSTFTMFMNKVFAKHIGKHPLIYLDDIVIYIATWAQHLKEVKSVLQTLREAKFYAKPTKCSFFQEEVNFLGHVVTKDGIKPDPEKVCVVVSMPPPRNKKDLQTFLGMVAYNRRFIPNFSELTSLLD